MFGSKFKNKTALIPSWNNGKLIGQKPPLHPKHIWASRTQLQMADKWRYLALFNLAVDSKLRGCDLVALKVEDIAPKGYAIYRATVREQKTGRSVKFEITKQTRLSVDQYLSRSKAQSGGFYSVVGKLLPSIFRRGNTLVWFFIGSKTLIWTRKSSAHIRFAEPRRR